MDQKTKYNLQQSNLTNFPTKHANPSNPNNSYQRDRNTRTENTDFVKLRTALRGKKANDGKDICVWFNMNEGCTQNKCEWAHICGKILPGRTEPCQANHSMKICTKK